MKPFSSAELQKVYSKNRAEICSSARQSLRDLRGKIEHFAPFFDKVAREFPDHFFGFGCDKLYVRIEGARADFANATTRMANLLVERPDIEARSNEFTADFRDSKVHLYLASPTDCRMIEVTETRTVLKPHPECVAALKQLEDLETV